MYKSGFFLPAANRTIPPIALGLPSPPEVFFDNINGFVWVYLSLPFSHRDRQLDFDAANNLTTTLAGNFDVNSQYPDGFSLDDLLAFNSESYLSLPFDSVSPDTLFFPNVLPVLDVPTGLVSSQEPYNSIVPLDDNDESVAAIPTVHILPIAEPADIVTNTTVVRQRYLITELDLLMRKDSTTWK
jgi:hypothetical protein